MPLSTRLATVAAGTRTWSRAGLWRRLDLTRLGPFLRAALAEEADKRRLFPWIAVAFGSGILLAFVADGPLSVGPPAVAGAVLALAAALTRTRIVLRAALVAAAAVALGFTAALVRMDNVAAPLLARQAVTPVEGFVEAVEERATGGRLVIRVMRADRIEPGSRPARIRVTTRRLDGAAPGAYVAATVRLLPLPEAARPGGYDFARDAYFRGIGAVGSVSGGLRTVSPPPVEPGVWLSLVAAIDRSRNALTARMAGTIGGQAGAVAAALVTGKRGLIDDHSNDILRAAGIYHIVSISGLHMVLAAGAFFAITRGLLALSAPLALGWPIKKIAAASGMVGATLYDVFSGSDVATERSLLMILVMQGAILFDRPALSLRNLALSALLILSLEPEALLGPSLQMSYAAVAGLIAMAEWSRGRPRREPAGWLGRSLSWLAAAAIGTVATTVVATIATGPFSSFHFQNLQPYGVIGNAVTLPLVSLVVMPCAVLGMLALPFGLDRPVWSIMGYAVQGVLALSEWVAGLPGAALVVPAFGPGPLMLAVAALLLAVLPVSRLRWLAVLPLGGAVMAAALAVRPDIYLARDGTGAAIRGPDRRLVVVGRVSAFTAEQWLKADGDGRRATEPSVREGARCDPLGCTVRLPDGRWVAFVQNRRALERDCRRAAIVLSGLAPALACAAPLVIDRAQLADSGAVAIRTRPDGDEIVRSREPGRVRPWVSRRPTPAVRAATAPVPATPSPEPAVPTDAPVPLAPALGDDPPPDEADQ